MSKYFGRQVIRLLISSVLFVVVVASSAAQRYTSFSVREPIVPLLAVMPGHIFYSSDEYDVRTASCDSSATGINQSVRLYASARLEKGTNIIKAIERVWSNLPNVVPLEWPLFAHKGRLNQFANVQWGSNRSEIGMEGNYKVKHANGESVGSLYVKAACQARW